MWITIRNVRKNSLSTCGQTVHNEYDVINTIQFVPISKDKKVCCL